MVVGEGHLGKRDQEMRSSSVVESKKSAKVSKGHLGREMEVLSTHSSICFAFMM